MTDPGLRNRFDFGAPPPWSSATPTNPLDSDGYGSHGLPGAYIPDDRVDDPVDDIPHPESRPQNATQNPDKTCRICLSGAEDGTALAINRTDDRSSDLAVSLSRDDEIRSFVMSQFLAVRLTKRKISLSMRPMWIQVQF